jgi:hypothetical protein
MPGEFLSEGSEDESQGEAKRMRSVTIPLLISAILLLLPQQAFAANRQAKERLAKKACLAGDPTKGVEILAELYVDTNDITYIFNSGRCFEQSRKYEDAIGRFREYLVKGEKLTAEEKAVAQKRIEACESYLPKSEPRPPVVSEPAPLAPAVQPQPTSVPQEVVTATPQPQQADEKAGSGLRIAGITVAFVGVAALITGVALNIKVNSMSSDLQKPDNFNRDTDTSRKDYKTLGWVSYGVGAACLAGGSLLYYLGWNAGRTSTSRVALLPFVAPDMAGALLGGSF